MVRGSGSGGNAARGDGPPGDAAAGESASGVGSTRVGSGSAAGRSRPYNQFRSSSRRDVIAGKVTWQKPVCPGVPRRGRSADLDILTGILGDFPYERPGVSDNTADPERMVPGSLQTSQERSERVKLRRGLAFLGLTLVLPGSAQVAAGNRRLGLIAVRIWAGLWAALVIFAVLALGWRSAAVDLVTTGWVLVVLQVLLIALALAWGALFLDAWRLARPPELARRHRLGFAALNLGLVIAVVGGLVASASMVSAQRSLVASVFTGGGTTKAQAGRYNILLMGGDADTDRVGLRPDSMTVASVDAETGRTVLVSMPRNLEDVPFPASSPLHKKFPKGYGCPDHSCMLNAVYSYATEHKNLYPGVKDPGAQATKEAVEGATGLKINYYVLIDLKGFRQLVDAVGGITLDINKRVPIGGGSSPIKGWIETGRNVHLDGYHALWFARSRADSSDYERIARQKCVMNAMLGQLEPVTVLTKFNKIAAAGKEILASDIPTHVIDELMDLALRAKAKPIASVAMVPPLVYPGSPDFAKIRKTVVKKIAAAEAADKPKPTVAPTDPGSSASPSTTTKKKKKKAASASSSASASKPGMDTNDLGAICSAG